MTQDNIPGAAHSLARLVQELNRLPGIGPKSAQRLAYHIIRLPDDDAYALADAVTSVKQNIVYCEECQNLTDISPCPICSDPRRDKTILCVVEDPLDVLAMERTRSYQGLYHVLHGVIFAHQRHRTRPTETEGIIHPFGPAGDCRDGGGYQSYPGRRSHGDVHPPPPRPERPAHHPPCQRTAGGRIIGIYR